MTLAQLKYAITVAGTSSMNEAAKKLFISQPSLSASIKDLEEEVGVEIFKRTNRGISVTPKGEEFIGYAKQVVEQYDLIESKYILKENTKKKFGVSMQHYTFAVNAFVEMVKQFGMDEYEFEVRETKTYDVIEDVKNAVFMYICGRTIPLPTKKKSNWKNWKSTHAFRLIRDITILFILQKRF